MNLIDFHVTKIINEEYGKVYELLGITKEQAEGEIEDFYSKYLLSDGLKQTYEYWDYGGTRTNTEIFIAARGQIPYYAGYVGQH